MDLKIILILVVLIGIVLVICWYSCPSQENYKIPWRPKGDRYKAPNVGFTNADGSGLGDQPYTGCSDSNEFSIYWVCDYSTTIYNPDSVHFNLTTIVTLSGGPTAPTSISGDISPSDSNVDMNDANNPIVYYKYTYSFDEGGIFHPGNYVLYLNSFVSQSENVPKGQKTDSDITEGNMVIYDSQEINVKNITIRDDDDITDEFYVGQDIIVDWEAGNPSFPSQGVTYTISLVEDITEEESNIVDVGTATSHTYSGLDLIGNYTAVVKTVNDNCTITTNGKSSAIFTIDYPPVPVPTIISLSSFNSSNCEYTQTMPGCDIDDVITLYWCMDFTEDPEYNPLTSGNPDFTINVNGTDHYKSDEVENENVRDVYFYSYNFDKGADPGVYTITVQADSPYNGGDKQSSDPSVSTKFSIYQYDSTYSASNLRYDRDPPVYSVNDTVIVSWDPPVFTGDGPIPLFNYITDFGGNDLDCGTCRSTQATIKLVPGLDEKVCTCTDKQMSISPGTHPFSVRTGIDGCNGIPNERTSSSIVRSPVDFTVVNCLNDNECGSGLYCDPDGNCT